MAIIFIPPRVSISGGFTIKSINTDITAIVKDEIWVDSSSNVVVITLPLTPVVNDEIIVYRLGVNDVTIDGNGNNVGGDTTLVLDLDKTGVKLTFILGQWQAVQRTVA